MKHLYFIRHGLTHLNAAGVFSGKTDTHLTDEGREQCRTAAEKLKEVHIDCIVSSPLTRTMETARIIAEQLGYDPAKIIVCDFFIERDFGPLEGTPYPGENPLDEVPGVEHSDDLIERVDEGYKFLQTLKADSILLVSHGAVGRALRSLVQSDASFHDSPKFHNAEVVKLI